MTRCPLCRAALDGADICRRCRADLGPAKALEHASNALAGAASYRLAAGDEQGALALMNRAVVLHATREHRALRDLLRGLRDRRKDAGEA